MAEREIGVGVIGFGLGGRIFHAPFVSAVKACVWRRLCSAQAMPRPRLIP